jgi:peptidoglycan/xylan/chitin deacetylase (PgdA/CDA1 family)
MHNYFIKTPWLVKKLYPNYVWNLPATNQEVYLTFDDGPHPQITPWVLEQLRSYNAKATFFCIGKNVVAYPQVYAQLLAEGHAVGNHTHNHLNGWKVPATTYIENVKAAAAHINSSLFRPPYGRIKRRHLPALHEAMHTNAKVIMWDVLSADFDVTITKEQCAANVLKHTHPGSIVVFHDSEKAFTNLQYALPLVLEQLARRGVRFEALPCQEKGEGL